MSDFVIKRGAFQPYLNCTLQDANGAVDLSGKSVSFYMWDKNNTMVIDGQSSTMAAAAVVVTSSTAGRVRYVWQSTDAPALDPGTYFAEWKWPSSSAPGKFPSDSHLSIVIEPTATT